MWLNSQIPASTEEFQWKTSFFMCEQRLLTEPNSQYLTTKNLSSYNFLVKSSTLSLFLTKKYKHNYTNSPNVYANVFECKVLNGISQQKKSWISQT